MKKIVLLTLVFLISTACSHRKVEEATPTSAEMPKILRPSEKPKTSGVFHIIHPEGVEIEFWHLDKKKSFKYHFNGTLVQIALNPGHWQVKAFKMNGQRYEVMNTSKKFVFKIATNKSTYSGSYIFQCPKVSGDYLREMKKMTFFNRYPFSSKSGLCELVVGSAYDIVNKVWVESDKEHRALTLGF